MHLKKAIQKYPHYWWSVIKKHLLIWSIQAASFPICLWMWWRVSSFRTLPDNRLKNSEHAQPPEHPFQQMAQKLRGNIFSDAATIRDQIDQMYNNYVTSGLRVVHESVMGGTTTTDDEVFSPRKSNYSDWDTKYWELHKLWHTKIILALFIPSLGMGMIVTNKGVWTQKLQYYLEQRWVRRCTPHARLLSTLGMT